MTIKTLTSIADSVLNEIYSTENGYTMTYREISAFGSEVYDNVVDFMHHVPGIQNLANEFGCSIYDVAGVVYRRLIEG